MPHLDEPEKNTVEDEVSEFDSNSNEQRCAGEDLTEEESNLANLQNTRDTDFLMGANPDLSDLFVSTVDTFSKVEPESKEEEISSLF